MQARNKTTLRQLIHDSVIEDILSGVYGSDELLNEKDLIEKYNTSKSPVRDALIELCNEGILRSVPRLGYLIMPYSQAYYDGIIRFRTYVEPHYLNMYWDRLTPEAIDELVEYNAKLESSVAPDDPLSVWKYNKMFHMKLASYYHDDFYTDILRRTLTRETFIFSQIYWNDWNRSRHISHITYHKKFLDALIAGNREQAVSQLTQGLDDIEHL